ncbi:hypothetical protein F511_03957 [Dorcoceras hygrometricum]|uniref:Dystroglycan-like n=1 Tax=Dorcoceras hygrometricum TaxID=472368 RepID=A0A2Z7BSU8_9LAMI|nr:hypothetical protein F511_03957 [Dorcoceras hygrometricum]
MASSLISSSHHIDFDSVFSMEDASLAPVFESLIITGLKEFLGCPAIFYEAALTEFFANGSVRDGVVVSTIGGIAVEISESVFATTFELPSEGLIDLSDVPKNLVFDARSLFSDSKEQVSISCLKKELKIEYRLLHDILAKMIYVKAGSFDAVTRDRFMLMTAITYDVKINWCTLFFGVLKAMVTPGSRQAKGFAIQIGVVLSNIPGLELGEPRAFPPPRVLNEKTVHRFVHINEQVGVEKTTGSPPMKKTPKKRAVSKKRPVDSDAEVAPLVKKKRTTKSKPAAAIRLPIEEPVSTTSEPPVVEVATGERELVAEVTTGDADTAIEQVLVGERWRIRIPALSRLPCWRLAPSSNRNYKKTGSSRPKNLKISKATKTGPISNIGPKTSRAARDRPELNPRRNQPSRHRRSITGRRPAAAAATHEIRAQQPRNVAPSATHGRTQHRAPSDHHRPPCSATSARHPAIERPIFVRHRAASAWRSGRSSCAIVRGRGDLRAPRAADSSPHAAPNVAQPVRIKEGQRPASSIGYPRMSASGESSTTMHRLLHASGSHPFPPPDDPKALDEELENANQEIQDSEDETDFDVDIQELPVLDETRRVLEADFRGHDAAFSHYSRDYKIRLGESISIPGVQERDLFYASLPRISVHDKGKEILVEDEPVRGNPARETVELICGDVDFLVQLRDRIMEDVVQFFHSFSLNKLTDFDGLKALKAKESLMLNWAETDSLEMAVRRRAYILAKYKEMLLRKFLESHRKYLVPGQPWTAAASQIIDLLSVVHSKSLEVLVTQQKENCLPIEQPCTSTYLDTSIGSGAVLAQFFSQAKSKCWVRPMVQIDGMWTPIQGPEFLRSSCKLSLFVNKRQVPESVVEEDFVPHGCLIEPFQYWGAAPSLIKTWGWARVCTEVIRYGMFGCLRPVREDICRDIVVSNLGVERIPAGFQIIFRQGMDSNSFVNSFVQLDSVDIQSTEEFESASSDGSTVYRSPSPILQKDDSFDQEELLYIVESPESSPSMPQRQESSSSSSYSQMHFDSNDLLLDDTTEAQTSLPAATVDLYSLLDALQASLFQRQLQDDLQILRLNELKKSVMAQGVKADTDSLAIRSKFNALDAKLLLLDGQVAAIRSEQLEFQAKITADLLSLSTKIGDIVDYIRGGDTKKGEGSSSRRPLPSPVRVERRPLPTPQPPPDVQGSGQSLSVEHAAERQIDGSQIDWKEKEPGKGEKEVLAEVTQCVVVNPVDRLIQTWLQ